MAHMSALQFIVSSAAVPSLQNLTIHIGGNRDENVA